MADTATLSSKFQISVCEAQRWRAGQEFAFIHKGKGVLIMPVLRIEDLKGLAKGAKAEGYRDRSGRF